MSASYLALRIQKELVALAEAALHVPTDVPERCAVSLAKLQGKAQAFRDILDMERRAVREDLEADKAA